MKVFISYAREDSDFSALLTAKLEQAGHQPFFDQEGIRAGDGWQSGIDEAIRSANALLVVLTPHAVDSEYVAYEWAFALGAGVRVIPVLLVAVDVHPRLAALQRLDFTNQSRPWRNLLAEIETLDAATNSKAPQVITKAVAQLDSTSPSERAQAVNTLSRTDHPLALDALLGALENPVLDVRMEAAFQFPNRSDVRIARSLLEAVAVRWRSPLNSYSSKPPQEVWSYLGDLQRFESAIVSLFVDALTAWNIGTALRGWIIDRIGELGARDAVAAVVQSATDSDQSLRVKVASALGQLPAPASVTTLLGLLSDDRVAVRTAAAKSLGRLGEKSSVPALIARIQTDDADETRRACVHALAAIGASACVGPLALILKNQPRPTMLAIDIAEALAGLGDGRGRTWLRSKLTALGDEPEYYRAHIMGALIRLQDRGIHARVKRILLAYPADQHVGQELFDAIAASGPMGLSLLNDLSTEAELRGRSMSSWISGGARNALFYLKKGSASKP